MEKEQLPPELCNKGECLGLKLFNDGEKLKIWRSNLKGISYKDKNGNFVDVKQVKSPKRDTTGAFISNYDLLREGTSLVIETKGQEFPKTVFNNYSIFTLV